MSPGVTTSALATFASEAFRTAAPPGVTVPSFRGAVADYRLVERGVEVHLVPHRRAAEAARLHPAGDGVAADPGLTVVHAVDRAAGVQQERARLAGREAEAGHTAAGARRQFGLDAGVEDRAVVAGRGLLVLVLERLDVVAAVGRGRPADPAGDRDHREVLRAGASGPGDGGVIEKPRRRLSSHA